MSLNHLILRNLKKNIRNYYLYVFALIFSVALYFSFVTLKYDPSMDEAAGTVKGGAAIGASSVLLMAIVAVFLLYANTIFIKRRGKEIGLFQLIGLTKNRIFMILSTENLILYFGSMIAGIAAGFIFSRLILMILFKIIEVEAVATLRFSSGALLQTILVFAAIFVLIMLMNYIFIKKQSILNLFRVTSAAQERARKMSIGQILIGLLGIALISTGYYISTKLLSGKFNEMIEMLLAMIVILASVILGTYLFYKGSVTFIFNLIRKSKQGYLSINEVLSLSSIMFRMKSNALLLTIVTTVSALAIGLLSLSYISYYSAGSMAKENIPDHFSFAQAGDKDRFTRELAAKQIAYEEIHRRPIQIEIDASTIFTTEGLKEFISKEDHIIESSAVSEITVEGVDLAPGEVLFMGYSNALASLMPMHKTGEVGLIRPDGPIKLRLIGTEKQSILPTFYSGGGAVAVLDDSLFQELSKNPDPKLQREDQKDYYGINLKDSDQLEAANKVYMGLEFPSSSFSQYQFKMDQRQTMGLIMFIVGFLGLTFLVTSGCILYFKQMDESEEEKSGYTILRKLGFTQGDLLRGIRRKQLFNFGIPLVVGLCHSYFAVKSGWFLFGTELVSPMIAVMLLYTLLYSIFGLLSVQFYKQVIKESL